ncbi:hypothetical protein RQP46_004528 [Phenoliferia psychrophenolica]
MSLPFPGERPSSETSDSDEEELPSSFISTTTQPLPGEPDATDSRPRTLSAASSSVLDRGRPKSRAASSFFNPDGERDPDHIAYRPSSDFGSQQQQDDRAASQQRDNWNRADSAGGSDYGGQRSRTGSFFGLSSSPGPESSFANRGGAEAGPSSGAGASAGGGGGGRAFERGDDAHNQNGNGNNERRSSFYGIDGHLPQTPPGHEDRHPPAGHPVARTLYQSNGGESGSGSYSSHDNTPRAGGAAQAARYHSAPYAASKAASLYGINSQGDAYSLPPAAPLLDQSHLQPGTLASLLSHDKTLELYRTNAKKTNDPDVQFEFCTFVMEVVGEMEESQDAAVAQLGAGEGQADPVAKSKQQALVAESVALLSKLAHRGHVKSQYFLADCYTQGIGTAKGKRDYDKAFPLFVLAGKHGHADACFRAAQCCENGWGGKRDQTKAVTLYRRAAVLTHPGAMHRLGLAEINGEMGLSKRPREGVKWLKRAAELADAVDPPQPQSLHELAMLSEKGIDNVIFKDEEYAAELLARASELQYAPSAYKLGECYEYGKMGCPQDSALSIHYYNIAAQQNHREACFALTAWYLVGSPGVLPQSDTEAYLWARKAADMGLAKAEYAVGYFTEVGIGTHKDDREALEWFRKAADQGDKRALDRLRMATAAAQRARDGPPPPSTTAPPPPPPKASKAYKPPPQTRRMQKKQRDQSQDEQPPPRSASANGKHTLPAQRNENGRPPAVQRQRSHSQPTPVEPGPTYAQLSLSTGPSAAPYGQYDIPNGSGEQFRPIQSGEARMPSRQSRGQSPDLPKSEARDPHHERVLQRGKRGPEDKDCIVS